ncbi:MAG: hypothetical protein LBS80_03830 [Tannerella sp.]|jgi:epoxyqueuosine reductase QueG|nr:hypothetical protein [Tannerella sp.]
MRIKEQIRELILSLGADVCGFAHVDSFDKAPSGFKPRDIFSDCQSIISFGMALPKGLAQINPRLVYKHFNDMGIYMIDELAFKAAKKIQADFDCLTVPIPCDDPYEYWESDKMEGRGLLSMKHIAVAAGLGALGENTLLLNKRFGNMLTLGVILTDMNLPSDHVSQSICMDNCHKCVDNCPVGAIENGVVNQKLCRNHAYGKTKRGFNTTDCNLCRTICPMRYGDEYK